MNGVSDTAGPAERLAALLAEHPDWTQEVDEERTALLAATNDAVWRFRCTGRDCKALLLAGMTADKAHRAHVAAVLVEAGVDVDRTETLRDDEIVRGIIAQAQREAKAEGAQRVVDAVEECSRSFERTAEDLRRKHATSEASVAIDAAAEFRTAARRAAREDEPTS